VAISNQNTLKQFDNAGHVFVPVGGKPIDPRREQITQIIADFFESVQSSSGPAPDACFSPDYGLTEMGQFQILNRILRFF
jgi:hypothetical protein